jgi:predicted transposase YbfD/YdcC
MALKDASLMVTERVQEISAALVRLAAPDLNPKQLFHAVRQEFPDATRKEIVRAAFFAVITTADADGNRARKLQNFALAERPVAGTEI